MNLWPLVVYFLGALALAVAMLIVSYPLGERHAAKAAIEPFESGIVPVEYARVRLSAKFYLVAMFFVIFDLEAVFIFAWAVSARDAGWTGYVEMLIFVGILVAALVYLWKLGGLDWAPEARPRSTVTRAPARMQRPAAGDAEATRVTALGR